MHDEPGLVVRTRVRAERIDEFERWLQEVLTRMRDHVPDAPELQLFREWTAKDVGDASVDYMLFAAGTDLAALDLEPVLHQIYGPERGEAELARFEAMLDGEQVVWRLQPFED